MNDYNKQFGKRISEARKALSLTMKELGKLVSLHESTIQRYESGDIKKLEIEKAKEFAKALRVDPIYLLGWEENKSYTNSIMIPVYGSIPAGVPLEVIEDIQGEVDIPVEWTKGDKKYIALIVKGDSMYPKYLDGDTVIIQLQKDCESGQDCACYVNGYEATLKRVNKGIDTIMLTPLNPSYPPKTFKHPGEVDILGVVKELRRKI